MSVAFGRTIFLALSVVLGAGSLGGSPARSEEPRSGDEFLIVDCLLPGQIRKLGRKLSFLTPRRPVRTTQRDCEIRGGEYVSYDRADYGTALKIWLPLAQDGDPKAQTYIGEIAEKGLGQVADYEVAALWYRRAAEQGYAPAQINLGQLYEKGLGVERDKAAAVMWYRRASGLGDADFQNVAFGDAAGEIERLQSELSERTREVEALRTELSTLGRDLASARSNRQRVDAELTEERLKLEEERRALASRREALAADRAGLSEALEREADAREKKTQATMAKLAQERQLLSRQAAELAAREASVASEQQALEAQRREAGRALSAESKRRAEELAAQEAALERQAKELAARDAEVEREHRLLEEQRRGAAEADAREKVAQAAMAKLAQERQLLSRQAAELAAREASVASEQQALEAQRREAGRALSAERKRRAEELAAQESALERQAKELAARKAEVEREHRSLEEQQRQSAEADAAELERRTGELAERQRRLDEREQLFAQRETERGALNRQIAELDAEIEKRRADVAALQRGDEGSSDGETGARDAAAPRIQMIEPRLVRSRGATDAAVVYTQADTKFRTIVGKVIAPLGFYRLFVNARPVEIDENALFQTEIPVSPDATRVEIVALDKTGQRTEVVFELRPETPHATQAAEIEPKPEGAGMPAASFGRYYALIIGNYSYRYLPKLETPRADVGAFAKLLERKYGFETTVLLDATRYEILSALNKLRGELTEEDNLLVYYAGHGELDRVNQRGHWLPVDAESDNTANWIANTAITDILNTMSVRKAIVIADSCYSGSLTRSMLAHLDAGRSPEAQKAWLEIMVAKKSRMAFTSGGLAPVLDGGGGRHSIFAKALLDALRDNSAVLDGRTLHQIVAQGVSYAAGSANFEQLPQYAPIKYAGHEAGDFFFVPRS